jgi:hypothetical protein
VDAGWVNTGDLTAKTNAPAAATGTSIAGFAVAGVDPRVYYLGENGEINELAWNPGWVNNVIGG